jgi:hypothetical protein
MDGEYFADQPFQRPNNCRQEHGENDDDDDNSGSALWLETELITDPSDWS